MKPSLTSVTFKQKSIPEIVSLAKQAELAAIEWGANVHVLPGDIAAAKEAKRLCQENGLAISGYGSYYYATEEEDFAPVLECAKALETPIIRVWPGKGYAHSDDYPPDVRARFTERLAEAVRMAAPYGITVATEYHSNSLTHTVESTLRLLEEAPGLKTYWQHHTHPIVPVTQNLREIEILGDRIVNVHTYYWIEGNIQRTLSDGREIWNAYLQTLQARTNAEYAAIEFVLGGTEEQFFQDAAVLKSLLNG